MNYKQGFIISVLALLMVVLAIYLNHFNNSFHFDDSHTIESNIYLKKLSNIPLFFTDGTTFSSLPPNQSYRPLVSTSLAFDYWLGGDLNVFYFHLSSFLLFIFQGLIMFLFFNNLIKKNNAVSKTKFWALAAVSIYLIHPACAETVNYIIARSDILSTLLVLIGFYLYQRLSFFKKYFLYLIPVIIGCLAKPTAIMFAPLFFIYILFFEEDSGVSDLFNINGLKKYKRSFFKTLPAFIICGLCYYFIDFMTPESWVPGGTSPYKYLITQAPVIAHYFTTFFLPIHLSADTDWTLIDSVFSLPFFIGCTTVIMLLLAAIYFSNRKELRIISFGLFWFFIALIPTSSFIPLSEVMNDHRLYFPYVGLCVSAVSGFYFLQQRYLKKHNSIIIILGLFVFSAFSFGTFQRNKVWDSDESLWYDVTVKSPKNGRGLMNYGLNKMQKGEYQEAEKYFLKALEFSPKYSILHTNLGVLYNALNQIDNAKFYHKKATQLNPKSHTVWYYYGKFLKKQKEYTRSTQCLKESIRLSNAYLDARIELMDLYLELEDWESLKSLANSTFFIDNNNPKVKKYLIASKNKISKVELDAQKIAENPSKESYLNLSLTCYNLSKFWKCIEYAQVSTRIDSTYSEGYNNISAAYIALKKFQKGALFAKKALKYNPELKIAQNNLKYAQKELKEIDDAKTKTISKPTANNFYNLGLIYYNKKMFTESIIAYKQVIKTKSNLSINAYNNICAAYNEMEEFEKAITFCDSALQIEPDFNLAKNNLNWAKKMLRTSNF